MTDNGSQVEHEAERGEDTAVADDSSGDGRETIATADIARLGAAALLVLSALLAAGKNLASFAEGVARAIERSVLPNWMGIEWPDYEKVEQLLIGEGLALAFVPNARIVQELLNASSATQRRTIIGRRSSSIVEDCITVLDTISTPQMMPYRTYGIAAARAVAAGHREAGQALATNTLDSVTQLFAPANRRLITSHGTPFDPDNFRGIELVIFGGLYGAYGNYNTSKGDPVPFTFNRHASAHGVSRRQYSKRNATIALMHLVALTKGLDYLMLLDGDGKTRIEARPPAP